MTAEDRERRLDRLRDDAARMERRPPLEPIAGYYGRPVLKPPVWTWEVPVYLFLGGVAGVSAVIAWVSGLVGDSSLARDARIVAFTGAAISPVLLISDLGRPARFLNMLRVFKPQSPMSVGAWTLALFTLAVFVSLVDHLSAVLAKYGAVVAVTDAVAAVSGAVLATYPGVLIGATAVPVWRRFVRLLPWHFAASSLGAAASILELAGHRTPALNVIAIAAAIVVTGVAATIEFRRDPIARPLMTGSSGAMSRIGDACSGPLPLLLRLSAGIWPPARLVASVLAIAGSLTTRFGWIAAGRESAQDPRLVLGVGR